MYSRLVLGGTFDHFHAGHRHFFDTAFSLAQHVLVGLTTEKLYTQKPWKDVILPYKIREQDVLRYALSRGQIQDIEIVPLADVYGTTRDDPQLEAILVTPHSEAGAKQINQERVKHGLRPLDVHICDLITDNQGEVLSSSRIRAGEIDREGFVYSSLFAENRNFSEEQKSRVRGPLGTPFLSFPADLGESKTPLICVGDMVTETAIKLKLPIASAWIDRQASRHAYHFPIPAPYASVQTEFVNPAGTIQADMAAYMGEHLVDATKVFILEGEEDLLTLVAIMCSPLQSRVVYGNAHGELGVTVVTCTEEKKAEIRSLLE
jgi:pantetheine-phosphate adenylyltransferase